MRKIICTLRADAGMTTALVPRRPDQPPTPSRAAFEALSPRTGRDGVGGLFCVQSAPSRNGPRKAIRSGRGRILRSVAVALVASRALVACAREVRDSRAPAREHPFATGAGTVARSRFGRLVFNIGWLAGTVHTKLY